MKILMADDDCVSLQACLQIILRQFGDCELRAVNSPAACLRELEKGDTDVVLLDISFTHGNKEGLKLIPEIQRLAPDCSITMLTSMSDIETINKCMALGASDFISKNNTDDFDQLSKLMEAAFNRCKSRAGDIEAGLLLAQKSGAHFVSRGMRNVYAKVARVIHDPNMHVLITGPTGTGKELVARAFSRQDEGAPFLTINSSCFSKDLFESELFGHEKGSFTGAVRQKKGFFEAAHGGDIFFDEVATILPEHQTKLLRVLESGDYYRTGGTDTMRTTARVIAATNEDLDAYVRDGRFREDLLQRFRRFHIRLPALKDRKEDIPIIIDAVIAKSVKKHARISDDCLRVLMDYNWPCNVRELQAVVNTMILNSNGNVLTIGDLPREFFDSTRGVGPAPQSNSGESLVFRDDWYTPYREAQKKYEEYYFRANAKKIARPISVESLARKLKMPKSTLSRKLTEYGIEINPEPVAASNE